MEFAGGRRMGAVGESVSAGRDRRRRSVLHEVSPAVWRTRVAKLYTDGSCRHGAHSHPLDSRWIVSSSLRGHGRWLPPRRGARSVWRAAAGRGEVDQLERLATHRAALAALVRRRRGGSRLRDGRVGAELRAHLGQLRAVGGGVEPPFVRPV